MSIAPSPLDVMSKWPDYHLLSPVDQLLLHRKGDEAGGAALASSYVTYWSSIGVVSALLLSISMPLALDSTDVTTLPVSGWSMETQTKLSHASVCLYALSATFSVAAIAMALSFVVWLNRCQANCGDVIFFITKFPVALPDGANIIGLVLLLLAFMCGFLCRRDLNFAAPLVAFMFVALLAICVLARIVVVKVQSFSQRQLDNVQQER
jgi:hypothetical protein